MVSRPNSPAVEKVLGLLRPGGKIVHSGAGWSARCPAHEDTMPSLSVSEGAEGRVLLNCHRGCTTQEIADALGLEMKDLFVFDDREHEEQQEVEWVANYPYHDESGNLLFQVQRFKRGNRKEFRQRKPDGAGGWVYTTTGIRKPLYRLPQILKALEDGVRIWVVEGEKDVAALEAKGLVATCNSGGAGRWLPEHTETLQGANVTIVSDNDATGKMHARNVYTALVTAGCDVMVLIPPQGYKDVSDLLGDGKSLNELVSYDMKEIADPIGDLMVDLAKVKADPVSNEIKLERAAALFDRIQVTGEMDRGRLVDWGEFLQEPVEEYDWVIPHLLERQERVITVAAEGVGKTMLLRQVAMMSAAGIHPFRRDSMPPIKTLTFDLENPERIIRRTTKKMGESLTLLGKSLGGRAHLVVKPDGLNLLKAEDRAVIEDYVARIGPDLICLGPIYKSFIDPGGRTAEAITTEVAKFFDHIRSVYGCAWWLEHHAPLGNSMTGRELRPFGSAVWSRWSEFGIALKPDLTMPFSYNILHYRGMRDERQWPLKMKRGDMWPFIVTQFLEPGSPAPTVPTDSDQDEGGGRPF